MASKGKASWKPFDADTYDDLALLRAEGWMELGLVDGSSPEQTAEAVDRWLDDVKRTKRSLERGVSIRVALAWGDAVARLTGWEWGYYLWGGQRFPGLASADRAHAHLPGIYISDKLEPEAEVTALLLFNMLAAGQRPPARPGDLSVIG